MAIPKFIIGFMKGFLTMGHELAPTLTKVYSLIEQLFVICRVIHFNQLACFVKNTPTKRIAIIIYSYVFQKFLFDLSQRFLSLRHVSGVILTFSSDSGMRLASDGNSYGCHVFTRFLTFLRFPIIHIIRHLIVLHRVRQCDDWRIFCNSGCSDLASSIACLRLALSLGMYKIPLTTHRDLGIVDISNCSIVSSSFGTKHGRLPWMMRNCPSSSRSSRNLMTLSPMHTFLFSIQLEKAFNFVFFILSHNESLEVDLRCSETNSSKCF